MSMSPKVAAYFQYYQRRSKNRWSLSARADRVDKALVNVSNKIEQMVCEVSVKCTCRW